VAAGCSSSDGQEKGGAHKKGGGPMGGMPAPEVNVVTVEPKSLPVTFEYVGQTAGSREVEVRARVTGILLSRNFKEGTRVKKGESLYTIDPAPFQAALLRAEADVAGADAREEQAKKNAARLKPLFAEKAVSQKDYDDAASAEQIAAADLKSARARLTEARLNLAYTKVESPINGQASRSLRSEGTLVSGPDVLLTTVVQVDPIWVNFGIPDSEQSRMQEDINSRRLVLPKNGTYEVSLRLADGTTYSKTGKLGFSDVKVNPATGTREARGEIPNPDGRIRPGEFVRVILKGATRPDAITVPQRAVLEGPQGKFVYVVDDKGTAQPRPVQAGEWNGKDWIVTGVQPGDKVIVEGLMRLGPGAPVRIAQAQDKPQDKQQDKQQENQQKPPAKK
jgi:membrane fusion protein (multidrug efflux system)